MDKKEIKEKTEKIELIYQEYTNKLGELKKEQNKVMDEFVAELEKAKMDEIRKKL